MAEARPPGPAPMMAMRRLNDSAALDGWHGGGDASEGGHAGRVPVVTGPLSRGDPGLVMAPWRFAWQTAWARGVVTQAVATEGGACRAVPVPGAPGQLSASRCRQAAAGQWCRLTLSGRPWRGAGGRRSRLTDLARGQVVREAFLGRMRRGRRRVCCCMCRLPPASLSAACHHRGRRKRGRLRPRACVCWARWPAALRLLMAMDGASCRAAWPAIRRAWSAVCAPWNWARRRPRAGEAPPYTLWVRLYDVGARPSRRRWLGWRA